MMLTQQKIQNNQTDKQISLNRDNYYDRTTDVLYQSPTFFKKFLSCEAETMAEINGEYKPPIDNKALLVGNYLHSYFESLKAHQQFIDEHKEEMFSKRKPFGLLLDYKKADGMIDTLKNDSNFKKLYQGQKEVIVTGQIGGVNWKGRIDCLNLDKKIFLDLKTTRDIHMKCWINGERKPVSFVRAYNYQLQMYVYQQLIYQNFGVMCMPYIIAVSKQDVPDKLAISINDEQLEEAASQIDELQEHIEQVRQGTIEPERCGRCEYCRSTAILSDIVNMDDLID